MQRHTSDKNGSDNRAFANPLLPRSSQHLARTRIPKTGESTNLITDTQGHYRMIHVMTLLESCRQQQVGEGHFARLEDVPRQAISLTVPALLTPRYILVIAPEARKAAALRLHSRGRSRRSVRRRFCARRRTRNCILIRT